jgi:HopA1 effector protein family/Domain of unknown function (DUF4157)
LLWHTEKKCIKRTKCGFDFAQKERKQSVIYDRQLHYQQRTASAQLSPSHVLPKYTPTPVSPSRHFQTRAAPNKLPGWSFTHIPLYHPDDTSAAKPTSETFSPQDATSLQKNTTGLPNSLKAGIETLSGLSLDAIRVHYHSSKPAEMQALAYTQGTEIYVGPGQEQHVPHEAWHVVQQIQGRVQPTWQKKGLSISAHPALEREAELMGKRAQQQGNTSSQLNKPTTAIPQKQAASNVVQLYQGTPENTLNGLLRDVYTGFDQLLQNQRPTWRELRDDEAQRTGVWGDLEEMLYESYHTGTRTAMAPHAQAQFAANVATSLVQGVTVTNRTTHAYFDNPHFDDQTYNQATYESRLSLHVHPDHLIAFKDYLIGQFAHIPYVSSFKIENQVGGAETILDNLIIYYHNRNPTTHAPNNNALEQIVNTHQNWLINEHPAMMLERGPGMSYGKEDAGGKSFGELRAEAMASGVLQYMASKRRTFISRDDFIWAAKQGLRDVGIDPQHPYNVP